MEVLFSKDFDEEIIKPLTDAIKAIEGNYVSSKKDNAKKDIEEIIAAAKTELDTLYDKISEKDGKRTITLSDGTEIDLLERFQKLQDLMDGTTIDGFEELEEGISGFLEEDTIMQELSTREIDTAYKDKMINDYEAELNDIRDKVNSEIAVKQSVLDEARDDWDEYRELEGIIQTLRDGKFSNNDVDNDKLFKKLEQKGVAKGMPSESSKTSRITKKTETNLKTEWLNKQKDTVITRLKDIQEIKITNIYQIMCDKEVTEKNKSANQETIVKEYMSNLAQEIIALTEYLEAEQASFESFRTCLEELSAKKEYRPNDAELYSDYKKAISKGIDPKAIFIDQKSGKLVVIADGTYKFMDGKEAKDVDLKQYVIPDSIKNKINEVLADGKHLSSDEYNRKVSSKRASKDKLIQTKKDETFTAILNADPGFKTEYENSNDTKRNRLYLDKLAESYDTDTFADIAKDIVKAKVTEEAKKDKASDDEIAKIMDEIDAFSEEKLLDAAGSALGINFEDYAPNSTAWENNDEQRKWLQSKIEKFIKDNFFDGDKISSDKVKQYLKDNGMKSWRIGGLVDKNGNIKSKKLNELIIATVKAQGLEMAQNKIREELIDMVKGQIDIKVGAEIDEEGKKFQETSNYVDAELGKAFPHIDSNTTVMEEVRSLVKKGGYKAIREVKTGAYNTRTSNGLKNGIFEVLLRKAVSKAIPLDKKYSKALNTYEGQYRKGKTTEDISNAYEL